MAHQLRLHAKAERIRRGISGLTYSTGTQAKYYEVNYIANTGK
jgi:hypothetical protein